MFKNFHSDLQNLIYYEHFDSLSYFAEKIGIKFSLSHTVPQWQEPSVIDVTLPVVKPNDFRDVPAPDRFPRYSTFTPEQRYIYLQFLKNPYTLKVKNGYLILLEYMLERNLVYDDYDQALQVMMKLKKIYKNQRFQEHSDRAIILTSILRDKKNVLVDFYTSRNRDIFYADRDIVLAGIFFILGNLKEDTPYHYEGVANPSVLQEFKTPIIKNPISEYLSADELLRFPVLIP